MRVLLKNGFYLEKDGPGFYYYNKTICNRIDRETNLAGSAAEMVKEGMDILDGITKQKEK